jgi:hypothetical protein
MKNILGLYHIIRNFPKNYPWYKKLLCNIIFFFTQIIIHPRKNLLTYWDLVKARLVLQRGDIVLMGNFRKLFGAELHEPVSHSSIYVGRRRLIHAVGDGVRHFSSHLLFTHADTLVILRIPSNVPHRRHTINKAVEYAESQFGKPYDYEFKKGPACFFCSELVNESFKHAGHKTRISSVKKPRKLIKKIEEMFLPHAVDALHPKDFVKGRFDVVFLSHNLKLKRNTLVFEDN